MIKLTPEQRARAEELLRRNPPPFKVKPKPKLEINVGDLSPRITDALRKQPGSVEVRVTARADEDVVVVDRPRRTEILDVIEVDREGRPAVARRYDCTTGHWGTVEFEGGYRKSGVETDWDPITRGLRRED
jgi:hypothetical protein